MLKGSKTFTEITDSWFCQAPTWKFLATHFTLCNSSMDNAITIACGLIQQYDASSSSSF